MTDEIRDLVRQAYKTLLAVAFDDQAAFTARLMLARALDLERETR